MLDHQMQISRKAMMKIVAIFSLPFILIIIALIFAIGLFGFGYSVWGNPENSGFLLLPVGLIILFAIIFRRLLNIAFPNIRFNIYWLFGYLLVYLVLIFFILRYLLS